MSEAMVMRRGAGGADIGLKKICDLTVGSITPSDTKQISHLSSAGALAQFENNKLYAIMANGTGNIPEAFSNYPARVVGFFQKQINLANGNYVILGQPLQLSYYANSRWNTVQEQTNSYCIYCENVGTDDICLSAANYQSVMYNFQITSAAIYEVSGIE